MDFIRNIERRFEFDMGHRVTNHNSKCRNIHGHRYAAIFYLAGDLIDVPGASNEGMIWDFGDIKAVLQPIIDDLDHGFMIWEQDPLKDMFLSTETKVIVTEYIPTVENIATDLLKKAKTQLGSLVIGIKVYETPNCAAEVICG